MTDNEFTVKLAEMVEGSEQRRKKWRRLGLFGLLTSLFNFEVSASLFLNWYSEDKWFFAALGIMFLCIGVFMAISCRNAYIRSEAWIRHGQVIQKLKDALESTEDCEKRAFAYDQALASFNELNTL